MEMAGIPIYGGYFTFDMAGMPIYGGYFTFDMVQCALLIAPYALQQANRRPRGANKSSCQLTTPDGLN